MNKKTVKALQELQEQLHNAEFASGDDRELINHLRNDIQKLLARSGEYSESESQTLREKLEDAIGRYEASHPELTSVMSQVVAL